jgi:hypothetical protein
MPVKYADFRHFAYLPHAAGCCDLAPQAAVDKATRNLPNRSRKSLSLFKGQRK